MIPVPVLDAVLIALATLFVLVSVGLMVDRLRHDRRGRQTADLHRRLTSVPAGMVGGELRTLVRRLTPAQFQELTLAGLPAETEASVARELRTHYGEDRLEPGAKGTGSQDVWNRMVSLHLLVTGRGANPDTYRALDEALRSGEPMLAGAAMRLLMRVNEWRAAELLVTALVEGAASRARLAAALDRMTVPYGNLLTPLFDHADPPVRAWAARLAGRHAARGLASELRALTHDTDAVVRRAAVEAIGRIGEPVDRDLLLARFSDRSPMVRAHAARAAAAFADAAMAAALVDLFRDREWIVRAAARDALQQMAPVARPALEQALWHADRFAANNAAEVLYGAGVISEIARRLLRKPLLDAGGIDTLARFAQVAGPHLHHALLAQFSEHEAAELSALLVSRPEIAAVPVRRH